ncbi:hypothetical protein [Flavobacterium sp. 3HN19-14]|uniref:hypothetical protein n=1 Tax=Flavobacterium sp. 3HN19-14 TaxID=3448133 RepID=UPI003EDEAB18
MALTWSNGTPNANVIATIEGDYSSLSNGPITAKNLTVTTGNVSINSGDTMHLEDELTVNGGTVTFDNNANLIQVNTATNTGNITMERDASMRRLDYVYWGSPVTGQLLSSFSPLTVTNRFYEFNEATHAFAAVDPAVTSFALGKGYSIRAPNNFNTSIQTFLGFFAGVPHNGTVNVAVTKTGQGYNLISNPYPSPISATAFATANPTIGTLYFWTHTNQVAASGANYATFNGTGAASANGSAIPNGTIQIGQGFLVKTPSAQNVVFNNAMRVDNHQNQFFRDGNTNTDKSRLWLNLSNETEPFSQLLVGYIDGATNDVDVQFDGKLLETEKSALYNLIGDEGFVIQGKATPFTATDVVPLGFKAIADGNFTITMGRFRRAFCRRTRHFPER